MWDLLAFGQSLHGGGGLVSKLYQTFVTPWTVCSPPGSSVHGILQARVLEWVAIPFSKGMDLPDPYIQISYHCVVYLKPI